MFDLISDALSLFSEMTSFYEVAAEANAQFLCAVSQLPSIPALEKFLNSFCKCDVVELSIKSYIGFAYCSKNLQTWKFEYNRFIEASEPDDNVTITLHINKSFDTYGSLSVYSFTHFVEYYVSLPFYTLLHELSTALKKYTHLVFHIIDKEVNLSTDSLCFYSNISMLTSSAENREEYFERLHNASLFLNQNDLSLMPNDFRVLQDTTTDASQLSNLLKKLETIFSYVYLAYSAHIVHDRVILQLSPTAANISLTYAEVVPCQQICDLFQWTFDETHTIERAGIVRNLLELNCRKVDDLILKDDTLLFSAKSNYILFQKGTVDKYIELKNSISNTIVEATNNIQGILQTLVDAVRNNFVAVIMFLITVIITDSINWNDLTTGTIMNSDLLFVIKVFCISSFMYLLITLVGISLKWFFFFHGYKELKCNYADLLDADDLKRAFNNDKAIKHTRNTIIIASSITSVIWIMFLYLLCKLVW